MPQSCPRLAFPRGTRMFEDVPRKRLPGAVEELGGLSTMMVTPNVHRKSLWLILHRPGVERASLSFGLGSKILPTSAGLKCQKTREKTISNKAEENKIMWMVILRWAGGR
eukprot:scaffold3759_cov169-Amphora_coffeaeformis.AAC.7